MSTIKRDRDGVIYRISGYPLPPPSSEKELNRQFYDISNLEKVCNDLLDRVYKLESKVQNLTEPKKKLEAEAEKAARYNCNVSEDQPNDVHIGFFNEGYKRGYTEGGVQEILRTEQARKAVMQDLGSAEEKSDV